MSNEDTRCWCGGCADCLGEYEPILGSRDEDDTSVSAPTERVRFAFAFGFRSACCEGEKCLRCGAPADGKIEEVIFDDDPIPMRHPFTAYLCKTHLRETLIAPPPRPVPTMRDHE